MLVDLHTHTTASDGRCAPDELVARAAAAGVSVLGVTDHDTVAGCPAAASACRTAGIAFVPGIEITSVRADADVHVLGYFLDIQSADLIAFLDTQRQRRIDRVREMVQRLAALGMPLDAEAIVRPAVLDPSRSAGRPWIADALVRAGFVPSKNEAFDTLLGRGCPAFVPRRAADPDEVIDRIHRAGGLASLAHPGLVERDEWIAGLVERGLDALEAYHTEHDAETTERYRAMADDLGVLVTGGSDFHGDPSHGAEPGAAALPADAYERLAAAARGAAR